MGARGEGLDLVVTPKGSVVPSSSGSCNTSNVSPSKAAGALKQRNSAYNFGWAIKKYLHTVARMNKATFLHIIFPLLTKNGYQLVKDRADFTAEEKEMLKNNGSIYRDFLTEGGIMLTLDNEFLRTLVPSIYSDP